jgi:PleD family two-component response regulator
MISGYFRVFARWWWRIIDGSGGARENEETGSRSRTDEHTTAKLTILVVEDDDDSRTAFTDVLEEDGYQVAQARDGREAEAYLRHNERPAAVVLDLMMPRLDGWSVAAMIKQGHLPRCRSWWSPRRAIAGATPRRPSAC